MKIAIVEDEKESLDNLSTLLDRYADENKLEITHSDFTSGEDFLKNYDFSYDIVFMDIILNGITGLKTSEKLRELDPNVYLIFITNMAQFAIEGYKYSAQDYFIKPVQYESIQLRLDRLKKSIYDNSNFYLDIPTNDGVTKIFAKNLLYVESVAHDMIFHTLGQNIKVRYKSLKELEEILSPYNFVKCNMCYLVNLKYCNSVRGSDLLIGDETIQISRAKRTSFIKSLSDYLSRGGH